MKPSFILLKVTEYYLTWEEDISASVFKRFMKSTIRFVSIFFSATWHKLVRVVSLYTLNVFCAAKVLLSGI